MELITLSIPAPAFDIQLEREMRKAAIEEADRALSEAVEDVKNFLGENYSTGSDGGLVPRVAKPGEVVCADAIRFELHRLKRILSAAHDQFQLALRRYNEIAP
jgi:hypothetical protein